MCHGFCCHDHYLCDAVTAAERRLCFLCLSHVSLLSQFPFLLRHVDGGQNLVGKLSYLPSLFCCLFLALLSRSATMVLLSHNDLFLFICFYGLFYLYFLYLFSLGKEDKIAILTAFQQIFFFISGEFLFHMKYILWGHDWCRQSVTKCFWLDWDCIIIILQNKNNNKNKQKGEKRKWFLFGIRSVLFR